MKTNKKTGVFLLAVASLILAGCSKVNISSTGSSSSSPNSSTTSSSSEISSTSSSDGMAELGTKITKAEAVAHSETFDYEVVAYHSTQTALMEINGTLDGITMDCDMHTGDEICFDFSDSSNYYFGYTLTNTNNFKLSMEADGQTTTQEFTVALAEGLQLDKSEDGVYTVNDYYDAVTMYGETTVETDPQSYVLDLSSEETIAVAQAAFFTGAGMTYIGSATNGLVQVALEDESTEYYLNSDKNILTIKGTSTNALNMSDLGFPAMNVGYDYVVQYDDSGLMVYYENTNYKTDSDTYTVTGEIKCVGATNVSVEHKKFYDIVKESEPEDTSTDDGDDTSSDSSDTEE